MKVISRKIVRKAIEMINNLSKVDSEDDDDDEEEDDEDTDNDTESKTSYEDLEGEEVAKKKAADAREKYNNFF